MRTLKTSEAAAQLNVTPNTLRSWERRFGHPRAMRSPGQHRQYSYDEVAALRNALAAGLSISSAVSVVEGASADARGLIGALSAFDVARANGAMEGALGMRSLEGAVEDVLLAAIEEVHERHGSGSAPWALAARWANDWLRRGLHVLASPTTTAALVVGDASRDEYDTDAPYVRALELFFARTGCALVCLPVRSLDEVADVARATSPDALVIAGSDAGDDEVARFAYAVRRAAGPVPVALYRRGRERAASAVIVDPSPLAAHRQVLELVGSAGNGRRFAGRNREEVAARAGDQAPVAAAAD